MFWLIMLCFFSSPASAQRSSSCRELQSGFSGHLTVQCTCNSLDSSSTLLSDLLNPFLVDLRIGMKSLVSHLMIVGCPILSITIDLAHLDRTTSAITDLSFEDIRQLKVKFSSLQESRIRLVFTNIEETILTGEIDERLSKIEMFFRARTLQRRPTVIFSRLRVVPTIRLLNFQDISEVRVEGCSFSEISPLDIVHPTVCHDRFEEESRVR